MLDAHRGLIAALTAALLAVGGAIAVFAFFLSPATSVPADSAAIVVLSGDHGERVARALHLVSAGWSGTLVVDGKPDSPSTQRLCQERESFEVVCLRPVPDNTHDEARAAARLAAERGWQSIMVVTSMQHVTRSRMLFQRCFKGQVRMVGVPPRSGVVKSTWAIIHETLGSAWALTHPGC